MKGRFAALPSRSNKYCLVQLISSHYSSLNNQGKMLNYNINRVLWDSGYFTPLFYNAVGMLHYNVVILRCGNVVGTSFSQCSENNLLTTLYNVVFTLCVNLLGY